MQKIKKLFRKINIALIILLPVVTVGAAAWFIGLLITFDSCFKSTCGSLAATAMYTVPLAGVLLLGAPLSVLAFKHRASLSKLLWWLPMSAAVLLLLLWLLNGYPLLIALVVFFFIMFGLLVKNLRNRSKNPTPNLNNKR